MIVALIALIFAMSGTAVAATHLVSGDNLIKKYTLSGNRLRNHTLTGAQIKLSALGKVPSAAQADSATNATHATSADTATSAGHATTADTATSATHATSADSATSAAPSGTAAGDLSGTYPNPTIANGAVGTAKFGAIPGARVRNSSGEAVTSGIEATLTYDTEDFDTGGLHSTTTNTSRLTAPVAGKYLIMASAEWASNTSGRRLLIILLNGSTEIARDSVSPSNTGVFHPEQTVETVYQLAAGDYVEVMASQDSGSPLNVLVDGLASPAFSMDWIAP